MKRKATARWQGTGLEGTGSLSGTSGVLNDTPYSFAARFVNEDGKDGTNPEELLAASHAGCFNMALSFQIVGAGFIAELLETEATVSLDKAEGDDFKIGSIVLKLHGKVPGMSEADFMKLAQVAKENCPISKALATAPITMEASFSA